MSDTVHFLLVYDLDARRIVEQQEFNNAPEAVARYQEMEKKFLVEDPRFEIVLVAADSIETVMATHGSYFDGQASRVSDLMTGIDELLRSRVKTNFEGYARDINSLMAHHKGGDRDAIALKISEIMTGYDLEPGDGEIDKIAEAVHVGDGIEVELHF